jgi:hypothetical protein
MLILYLLKCSQKFTKIVLSKHYDSFEFFYFELFSFVFFFFTNISELFFKPKFMNLESDKIILRFLILHYEICEKN